MKRGKREEGTTVSKHTFLLVSIAKPHVKVALSDWGCKMRCSLPKYVLSKRRVEGEESRKENEGWLKRLSLLSLFFPSSFFSLHVRR